MPEISDWDDQDPEKVTGSAGGITPAGGGAGFTPRNVAPSKQNQPQYVGWARMTGANSEVSGREAGKLQGQVDTSVNKAKGELGAANDAWGKAYDSNYYEPNPEARASLDKPKGQTTSFGSAGFNPTVDVNSPNPHPAGGVAGAKPPRPGGGVAGAKEEYAAPTPNADKITGWSKMLTPEAAADGAKLPGAASADAKDLEGYVGGPGWSSMTGDLMRAGSQAGALGSEGGVKALLGQNTGQLITGEDAALIGGAGGKGFQDSASNFGQGQLLKQQQDSLQSSQDAWSKLTGQVSQAQANAKRNADNAATEAFAASQKAGANAPEAPAVPMSKSDREKLDAFEKDMAASLTNGMGGEEGSLLNKSNILGELAKIGEGNDNGMNSKTRTTLMGIMSQLGLSWTQLATAMSKMTDQEYKDFIVGGVVPGWMEVGEGSKGIARNKPGQFDSGFSRGFVNEHDPASTGIADHTYSTIGEEAKIMAEIAKFVL